MSECTHDCSSCSEKCSQAKPESLIEKPHELSDIKKVIGIVSGKGGVGKSMVTSLMAILMNRKGYNSAILDADITGPSIPKAFGLKEKAMGNQFGLYPVKSKTGIDIMSLNLLLENETDPVVWRGPVIAGTVKQFWTDVIWSDVDFMFIDMPPGTGDVPLTVFQTIPVDGIIIVTSPQDLVSMIVKKALNTAKLMNIPVIGLVENYSYIKCPDCGKKIEIFGSGKTEEAAKKFGVPLLAQMPMDSAVAALADKGEMDKVNTAEIDAAAKQIEAILK